MSDTDFLKKRVAASAQPKVDTSGPTTSLADSADTFLSDVTADSTDVQSVMQKKLHKRAVASDAHDKEKALADEEKAARDAALAEDKARREKEPALSGVRVSQAVGAVGDSFNPVLDRVGSLPTIGGIGLLVAILVILLFTVVRVNDAGDTRLKQLWYMLNGRATIKGRVEVQKQIPGTDNSILNLGNTGTGVGGTFSGPDFAHAGATDLGF